jgi:hypothetical protein
MRPWPIRRLDQRVKKRVGRERWLLDQYVRTGSRARLHLLAIDQNRDCQYPVVHPNLAHLRVDGGQSELSAHFAVATLVDEQFASRVVRWSSVCLDFRTSPSTLT